MATASMGSHVIHYEDDVPPTPDPSCDPVVMVHSLGGNSWFWREWVPVLGDRRRIVRADVRGINGSTLPHEQYEYRLDDLVDDHMRLLDTLGLERVHHVGIATGALLGVVCAARYPDRFTSLTLMSAAPHMGRKVSRLVELTRSLGGQDASPEPAPATDAVRRLGLREWYLRTGAATGDLFFDERDDEYADAFAKTPVDTIVAMWEGMHRPDVDLTESAPLVQAPALVLHAEASATTTLADQQWLADTIPGGRLKVMPGWGSRMWFHHADVVSRTALEFIEDVERRT